MAIDLNAAKANNKSSTLKQPKVTDCGNDRGQHQTGEVSQALAATTAQAIRGQVSQTAQFVGELANQRSMVADHLSDQMVEVLDQSSFWEEVCARTLEKLEGRPQASPFAIEQIELPPMPEAATRYLRSSRRLSLSVASEQPPALVGTTTDPVPQNAPRKTAELPSITSGGNSPTAQKGASGGRAEK